MQSNPYEKVEPQALREQDLETLVQSLQESENALKLRVRQRGIVADLGQRALAGADLSALMDEAANLVAQILEVEYSSVMEALPAEGGLLLRAGYGWKNESIGRVTLNTGKHSFSGHVLSLQEPLIFEDLDAESRFEKPLYLLEHGIMSGISMVIQGHEKPFGIVGAFTTKMRSFSRDEINFLQTVANVLAPAIQRKTIGRGLSSLGANRTIF